MGIAQQQVQAIQNNVLTVPAGKRYAITNILVCNTYDPNAGDAASNSASFDLYFLPNGASLDGQVHRVVRELSLPAGETFTFDRTTRYRIKLNKLSNYSKLFGSIK